MNTLSEASAEATSCTVEELAELTGFQLQDNELDESAFPEEQLENSDYPLSSNPLLQIGVVALGTGLLCLGMAYLVGNVSLPKTTEPEPSSGKTETPYLEENSDDTGAIKTRLAFGEESDDLASLSLPEEQKDTQEQKTAPSSTTTTRTVVQPAPATPVNYTPSRATPAPAPITRPPVMPPSVQTNAPAAVFAPTTPPATVPQPPVNNQADEVPIPPVPSEPTQTESIPQTPPEEEEIETITIPSGSSATVTVDTPVLISSDVAIKSRIKLNEPLKAADGQVVLPADTILIVEPLNTASGAHLDVFSVFIDGAEQALPNDSVIALGLTGLLQHPDRRQSNGDSIGIDVNQAVLTGAIAALDIDGDSVVGGILADVMRQRSEQTTVAEQPALSDWILPVGTELMLHVNEPVSLPVTSTASVSDKSLIETAGLPTSLVGFGSVPDYSVDVVLQAGETKTIGFVQRGETVVHTQLSNEDLAVVSYDRPLKSGQTGLLHIQPLPDAVDKSGHLDVITTGSDGKRHWHRFRLIRS